MLDRTGGRTRYDVVIVGGGIAGLSAAESATELRPGIGVLLVNAEDRPPYKRTKISKNLANGFARDQFALRPAEWYPDRGIHTDNGVSARALNARAHHVALSDDRTVEYERLVLAPGAEPVSIPGAAEGPGLHVLRTAAEVEEIRRTVASGRRIAVIGNGVLGLEIVDQIIEMGKEVVLFGAGPALGNRADREISERIDALLREHGVRHVPGVAVTGLSRDGDAIVVRSHARDGGNRPGDPAAIDPRFDAVICCAGVRPRVDLAAAAGIAVDRGILVDEYLRTSASDVLAAGDAAQHPGGEVSYLWHDAEYQGRIAGRNASGANERDDRLPFRMKCEIFGHYFFALDVPVDTRGYLVRAERSRELYRALYFREGRLRGAVMIDDADRAKRYVTAVREGWDEARVANELSFAERAGRPPTIA